MHSTRESCSGRCSGTWLTLPTRTTRVPWPEGMVRGSRGLGNLSAMGWGGCCQHSPRRAGTGGSVLRPLHSRCEISSESLNVMPSPLSNRENILLTSAAFDHLAFFRICICWNKDCLFLCVLRASGTNYE